jgi:fructose 1,6-bisphosphatase
MKALLFSLLMFGRVYLPSSMEHTQHSRHDFHVSITVAEINPKNGNLEGYLKLFSDDVEEALKQNAPKKLEEYVFTHFYFKSGDKKIVPSYIGKEEENGLTYVYFEAKSFPSNNPISAYNAVFFDMFEDQSNIVNLKIKGENTSVFLSKHTPEDQLHL